MKQYYLVVVDRDNFAERGLLFPAVNPALNPEAEAQAENNINYPELQHSRIVLMFQGLKQPDLDKDVRQDYIFRFLDLADSMPFTNPFCSKSQNWYQLDLETGESVPALSTFNPAARPDFEWYSESFLLEELQSMTKYESEDSESTIAQFAYYDRDHNLIDFMKALRLYGYNDALLKLAQINGEPVEIIDSVFTSW